MAIEFNRSTGEVLYSATPRTREDVRGESPGHPLVRMVTQSFEGVPIPTGNSTIEARMSQHARIAAGLDMHATLTGLAHSHGFDSYSFLLGRQEGERTTLDVWGEPEPVGAFLAEPLANQAVRAIQMRRAPEVIRLAASELQALDEVGRREVGKMIQTRVVAPTRGVGSSFAGLILNSRIENLDSAIDQHDLFMAVVETEWMAQLVHTLVAPQLSPPVPELNEESRQILTYAAKGFTTAEIATFMGMKARTVSYRLSHMMEAFGCSNRSELTARATELGVVKP